MVGQTTQATDTLKDAAGNILSGRVTTWSSAMPAVASVSASGLVTALTIGVTDIVATSEGVSGRAAIVIDAPTSFGPGLKVVGQDIGEGLYRSNNAAAAACSWQRLSGLGGSAGEIIAFDLGGGPAVVAISTSDVGFNSSGCVTWFQVTGPITTSLTAPFGVGTYIVGKDVATGTWQSDGSGSGCSWARLSGFGGTPGEIVASFSGSAPATVTIAAGDRGFKSRGCGTWTKIG
jgi:Big-like domain-containing protein